MKAERLQLVLPARLHENYRASQRQWLMTLADFVELVTGRQGSGFNLAPQADRG
ncbi:type II restriction endonuclease [Mesorhizobium sp.]|uniref:type II restriction endonuclease n=1 Tax=Mesorhizobium sp. TaxID=1871066 RepID=UPI000FEA7B05|nr:MAG: hypothetical protein EOR05_03985 [Mesorhizobium sp.]